MSIVARAYASLAAEPTPVAHSTAMQWQIIRPVLSPCVSKLVEEVQLVMGRTPELFAAIATALTVSSETPWVDPSFAPPEVLRALPGMDEVAIANLLQARSSASARPAVMLGHAFTITAAAQGPDALLVRRSTVVRLTGRPSAPFWVDRWN